MEILKNQNESSITIPVDAMSDEQIENVISSLRVELITRKGKLTQSDADEIAREINRSWWSKNQDRIEAMIREYESANRN